MEPWQGINSHRAVYAAQTVSDVATGMESLSETVATFISRSSRFTSPTFDGIGYFPFDRRKKILAVSQRLAIQPVMSAAVDGIETQEDPISGPIRGDGELPGQCGGFVQGQVIPLLRPLTRHMETAPARGIQRMLPDILAGLRVNSPRAVQRDGVLR